MSTAVSSHSGAGPLSLMSCVRESSPPQDGIPEYEVEKNVSSKKKFWNPRKWFKRKNNKVSEEVISSGDVSEPKETLRSRSTSELSVSEEQTRRRSGTPMHPGLSVSHDSVFHSPHSGSELDLEAAQSSSSLSISHQPTQQDIRLQTELSERLRLRRTRGDTSEDDEGLPRSPCNSPMATDGCLDKSTIKDHPTKSHSTCSDGSLLSMGSSEMDEDSFGLQSRHSSKLSLHDKRSLDQPTNESETEWGPSHSSAPLNHSAAHHKVSIRPKRTHGAPRRKRAPVSVTPLPTTPEVNEDTSIRSATPESARETITELYTSMSHRQKHTITDPKIKCSSLPPGLAGPGADGYKLSRSRSNAGHKSQDTFSALEEEDFAESCKKSGDGGFFGKIFTRRSGKKKKEKEKDKKEEKAVVNVNTNNEYSININYEPFDKTTIAVDNNLAIRPNALRSGPASRQRMQPIDIPASPDLEKPSSPLQSELESHFKSKSPPKSPWQYSKKYSKDEGRSKIKIAGLSSLQQRVLSLNDDTDNSFKSLTNLPTDYEKPAKTITKSHSFKSATKISYEQKQEVIKTEQVKPKEPINIFKSISLDSVKNLEEKIVESVNEAKVTISGPSHKAIVNISGDEQEHVISKKSEVTKIQVKRESTQVTIGKTSVPEFFNVHLNKIEANPSNIILSTNQITEEHHTFQLSDSVDTMRRFSNDNIEVVKKISSENIEVNRNINNDSSEISRRYISNDIVNNRLDHSEKLEGSRFNYDGNEVGRRFNSDGSEFSSIKPISDREASRRRINSDGAEGPKRFNDYNNKYNNGETIEISRRYIKHDSAENSKRSNADSNEFSKRFSVNSSETTRTCDTNEIVKHTNSANSDLSKDAANKYNSEYGDKTQHAVKSEANKKIISTESSEISKHQVDVTKKAETTEVSRRYIKHDSIDISKKFIAESIERSHCESGESKRLCENTNVVKKTTQAEINRKFITNENSDFSKKIKEENNEVGKKYNQSENVEINRRYIKNDNNSEAKKLNTEVNKKVISDNSEVSKRYFANDSNEVGKRFSIDSTEVGRKTRNDGIEHGRKLSSDGDNCKKFNSDNNDVAKRLTFDNIKVSTRSNNESNDTRNSYEISDANKRFVSESNEDCKRNNNESDGNKRCSDNKEVCNRTKENSGENGILRRCSDLESPRKEEVDNSAKLNALVTVIPMNNRFYKKHDSVKKPAIASEKPMLKIKSNSFEAVEPKKFNDNSSKSSQNSLDKIEMNENVVLRRKSLIKQKTDDEPELMKVFARRSLKLKDSDSEALSQQVILKVQESENSKRDLQENQSDKENLSDSSPLEERKKTFKSVESKFLKTSVQKVGKDITQKPLTENQTSKDKIEIKTFTTKTELKDFVVQKAEVKDKAEKTEFVETSEVTLRKPVNNNKFSVYQRAVSLQAPKTAETKLLKSVSVVERPKTDTWFSKNQDEEEDDGDKEEVQGDEIITEIQELNVKPKNFNQRKAEWEKRAQEALKKTLP